MANSDIETQLQKITTDIAALATTVASLGTDTAKAYRAKAGHVASDAIEASQGVLDNVWTDVEAFEKDVATRIRTRPMQSLVLAAGIGFLLAFVSRR